MLILNLMPIGINSSVIMCNNLKTSFLTLSEFSSSKVRDLYVA